MLNPHLTDLVTSSMKAAGITPPTLSPIRPFPKPRASLDDIYDTILDCEHEDPYEDPKLASLMAQIHMQSMNLDRGHRQRELARRATELESHVDALLEQLQKAFNTTARKLVKDSERIRADNPSNIDLRTAQPAEALAAINVIQGTNALKSIIKAWSDPLGSVG